jgi:hypothetical protein
MTVLRATKMKTKTNRNNSRVAISEKSDKAHRDPRNY